MPPVDLTRGGTLDRLVLTGLDLPAQTTVGLSLIDTADGTANVTALAAQADPFTGSLAVILSAFGGAGVDTTSVARVQMFFIRLGPFEGFAFGLDAFYAGDAASVPVDEPGAMVPLPAPALLLLSGLAGLGWIGRRSRGARDDCIVPGPRVRG